MRTIRHSSLVLFMFSFVLHQAIAQWVQTKGPSGGSVNLVWTQGTTLYAATDAGLYRSTDKGVTWVDPALTTTRVHAFLAVGTTVIAGTDVGIYRTTDNGATWARPSASLETTSVNAFAVIGSHLFAGTDDGIYRSTDGAATWNSVKKFSFEIVISLAVLPNAVGGTRLVAGCKTLYPFGNVAYGSYTNLTQRIDADGNIYSSADEGTTWKQHTDYSAGVSGGVGSGWTPSRYGQTLLVSGNRLFARMDLYGWWLVSETTYYLNFKSDIDTWQKAEDLEGRFLPQSGIVTSDLFLADPDGFMCRLDSTVTDATLQENSAPTKLSLVSKQARSLAKIPGGTGTPPSAPRLFVATADRGMWQSTDEGKTWTEANSGLINSSVRALICLGNGTSGSPAPVVAATSLLRDALGKSTYGMYTSTDKGTVWSATTSGPADTVTCMTSFTIGTTGRALVAGTNSGLYWSTDGGVQWTQKGWLPVVGLATAVIQGKPTLFVANRGVLNSTTDIQSSSWTTVLTASYEPLIGVYTSLNPSGNPVIYVLYKDRIDYSEDNGTTFGTLFQLFSGQINGITTAGNEVFVSANSGIYRLVVRPQGYVEWVKSYDRVKVNAIVTCGSQVFAATDSLGVLFSLDDGATWYPVNSGLTASRITSFAYDGVNLYAGTQGRGVFRYNSPLGVNPSIAPSAPASTAYGSTFWVDVVAGNPDNVTDLWDFWFDLVSDNAGCTYIDSSGTYGPFIAQGFVPQIPRTITSSAAPTLVHFDIQRKSSGGVTGSGVIARAQFKAPSGPSGVSGDAYATFSIKNFAGRNSKKERFYFHPSMFSVKFFKAGITVWPGDCNADGVVNANDILPLGVYYLASEYFAENQGILWQGYNRQPWTLDDTPKRVHADANGDRQVNSADLLAVGLNYGKTHSMSGLGNVSVEPSLSKVESEGSLSVVSVSRVAGRLRANLRLSASKPVYGIGFTLKYGLRGMSAETLRFIQVDTAQSVLGGGLIFSKPFDADGHAEIAMTKTDKVGFTGDGALLSVSFEAPAGVEDALRLEICQVVANDANGNPVSITGSVYQNSVTGLLELLPLRNELYQNYPNPFNPSTLIRFELSSRASVSLKIYDALGRELTLLTNGVFPAGKHSAVWDGSSYPSGVYFCVLRINEENRQVFVQTRRMMLVK